MDCGAKLSFSFNELNQEPNGAFYEHLKKPIVQNYCSTKSRTEDSDNLFELYSAELDLPSKQNRSIWEGCPNKNENDICKKCWEDGYWVHKHEDDLCIRGCFECVRQNNWTWGKFRHMPEIKRSTIPKIEEMVTFDIPCNGCDGMSEYNNLELAIKVLGDYFDTMPDYMENDPLHHPKWKHVFALLPERCQIIVCKECMLWGNLDDIGERQILPGESGVLLALYDSLCDGAIPLLNYVGNQSEEEVTGSYGDIDTLPLSDDDMDDMEEYENYEEPVVEQASDQTKKYCREAQELLDHSIANGFNEESYRQLSNMIMKLHENKA